MREFNEKKMTQLWKTGILERDQGKIQQKQNKELKKERRNIKV